MRIVPAGRQLHSLPIFSLTNPVYYDILPSLLLDTQSSRF